MVGEAFGVQGIRMSTSLRLWLAVVLVFAVGLGSAGCGDDDGGAEVCGSWECGTVGGVNCGECSGATEQCQAGRCVDVCAGRECGEVDGVDCGQCSGTSEACTENGHCLDVCAGRDCGSVGDVDCGHCERGKVCNSVGHCVEGVCPPDMVGLWSMGICMDAYPMTVVEAVALLNDNGPDCNVEGDEEDPEPCLVGSRQVQKDHLRWYVRLGWENALLVAESWATANSLCRWQGKRLCYLAELASACGGPEGYAYPYGDEHERCRCKFADACVQVDESLYEDSDCEGGYPGLHTMLGSYGFHTSSCTTTPNGRDCTAFAGVLTGDWLSCASTGGIAFLVRCCKDLEPL